MELVWHSTGDLATDKSSDGEGGTFPEKEIDPNETASDRLEREAAEAYYCKRAREIYESYVNAPNLYKTNADGEKEYLTDEEAATTLAETEAKVAELCS